MTTIGVLSDTHINPGGKRQLPPRIFEIFHGVDLILHAGDLNTLQVVDDLQAIAPTLAVYGNNDDVEAISRLPATRRFQIEDCWLGLVHGHQEYQERREQRASRGRALMLPYKGNSVTSALAFYHFQGEDSVDCVVFGHSHRSLAVWHEVEERGVLLFNPGSPTDKRYGPHYSCGLLRVDGPRIEPELITW